MKKIRMLQSMAGSDESWQPGDEREVQDFIADEWCRPEVGIAQLVGSARSAAAVETASVNPPRTAAMPSGRKSRGAK